MHDFAPHDSDTEPEDEAGFSQSQMQTQTQSQPEDEVVEECVVRTPPPTARRAMRRQSAILFQRLAAEAADASPSEPHLPSASLQRAARPVVTASKGKRVADPAAWDPADGSYLDSLRAPKVQGSDSRKVLPAVKDDLRLLATGVNLALTGHTSNQQRLESEVGRLEHDIVTLTATVGALKIGRAHV